MDDAASQLESILEVFKRLGITVRKNHLGGGGGGLCTVHGCPALFVDLDADIATQADRSVAALATVPQIDSVFLVPSLRERIEKERASTTHGTQAPQHAVPPSSNTQPKAEST